MIIIGIAGGTGSGKTTVVKKIAETLPPDNVAVIPLDSYYNCTDDLTEEQRRNINFDHPDAFDWDLLFKHISELKNGHAVEQPTYSYVISNRLSCPGSGALTTPPEAYFELTYMWVQPQASRGVS